MPLATLFLADAIKSLLGVDLVDQLGSDLKIYLNRSGGRIAGTDAISSHSHLLLPKKQQQRY